MKAFSKGVFSTSSFSLLFILLFANTFYSQTYLTVADGNWTSSATWLNGNVPPTANDIPSTALIHVRHTVAYNTGNSIKNRGEFRIQPIVGSTAILNVPSNINVENLSEGRFYVINGSFLQCRFVGCNNGQPYSGNNPGAPIQSGTFKNIGGYVELRNANVEAAQDFANENGGTRLIIDSCVTTGQNFSMKGTGNNDTIIRSNISIGWHGSGNFELSDGIVAFDAVRIQLAGSSGSVKLDSGTANGDIDYITLRNHVALFTGGGEISASSSLSTTGLNLDAYCVSEPSKYISNGKFSGTQTANCSLNYFPATCSVLPVTSSDASVKGRVTTARGRGISGVVVEISGGDLERPVYTRTRPFGTFSFDNLSVGHTYVMTVYSKQYKFSNPSRIFTLNEDITGFDFTADGEVNILQRLPR